GPARRPAGGSRTEPLCPIPRIYFNLTSHTCRPCLRGRDKSPFVPDKTLLSTRRAKWLQHVPTLRFLTFIGAQWGIRVGYADPVCPRAATVLRVNLQILVVSARSRAQTSKISGRAPECQREQFGKPGLDQVGFRRSPGG